MRRRRGQKDDLLCAGAAFSMFFLDGAEAFRLPLVRFGSGVGIRGIPNTYGRISFTGDDPAAASPGASPTSAVPSTRNANIPDGTSACTSAFKPSCRQRHPRLLPEASLSIGAVNGSFNLIRNRIPPLAALFTSVSEVVSSMRPRADALDSSDLCCDEDRFRWS